MRRARSSGLWALGGWGGKGWVGVGVRGGVGGKEKMHVLSYLLVFVGI